MRAALATAVTSLTLALGQAGFVDTEITAHSALQRHLAAFIGCSLIVCVEKLHQLVCPALHHPLGFGGVGHAVVPGEPGSR